MKQEKIILNFLLYQPDIVSGKAISEYTGISERNVKYTIKNINSSYKDLILIFKKGYQLNPEKIDFTKSLLEAGDASPSLGFQERKNYILTELLTQDLPLQISSVLDEFFITKNTLLNELTQIKKELAEYQLTLSTREDQILLFGSMAGKRRLLLDILEEEMSENTVHLKKMQDYIENINFSSLKQKIAEIIQEQNYSIDNYSLNYYVIHIAVLLFYSDKQPVYQDTSSITDHFINDDTGSEMFGRLVNNIYLQLKESYPEYSFSYQDIENISTLMLTRLIPDSTWSLTPQELQGFLGAEVCELSEEISRSVYNTYAIDLRNEIYTLRFGMHLKNLLQRSRQHIAIDSSPFPEIKKEFPLVFAIAVHIANIINQRIPGKMPESEISFIALYIGVIIEQSKAIGKTLRCLLIAPDHDVIRKGLIKRLDDTFHEQIIVTEQVTRLDSVEDSIRDVDLIISTFPEVPSTSLPVVMVNPVLSSRDIRHIRNYLENSSRLKVQNTVRNEILHFLNEDIFFSGTTFSESTQVIDYVCEKMYQKGFVDESFREKIYEHERVFPSSYGNVAIAHPLDTSPTDSAIAVLIQEKPIHWGYNSVNIVFIFTLQSKENALFSDIFNLIIQLVNDPQHFSSLLEISDFHSFVKLILSLI